MARLPVLTPEAQARLEQLGRAWWRALTTGIVEIGRQFELISRRAAKTMRELGLALAPALSRIAARAEPASMSRGLFQACPPSRSAHYSYARPAVDLAAAGPLSAHIRTWLKAMNLVQARSYVAWSGRNRFVAPFPAGVEGAGEWSGYA